MLDLQKKFEDMKNEMLTKLGLTSTDDLKARLNKALEIVHAVGVDKVEVSSAGTVVTFAIALHGVTEEQVKSLVSVIDKKLHPEAPVVPVV